MKKKYLLFPILILIFIYPKCRANELVIEVTTDKYPAENSWKLFDTNKNLIRQNGTLLKNYTHRDTVELDGSSCYYWTIYDSYGDGMSNSSAPGDYKIYLDGVLVAQCENPNFGDSISVFGLGSGCLSYDASLEAFTFSGLQTYSPFDLTFDVLNFGSETIHQLGVTYSINGNESLMITVDNLEIANGQKAALKLPEPIQLMEAGGVTIGLTIHTINGQDDGNAQNSSLNKVIEVRDGYLKKPLHEEFTSSTCLPCAAANPTINATLAQYPDQYALIKYQVNWPGVGDPYYTAEVGYMVSLYEISGVPSLIVDAQSVNVDYQPGDFESHLNQLTPIYLQIESQAVGDSVFATVHLTSQTAMSETEYLRVALVEKVTYNNVSTNGETEFENVFMKFLSNKAGTDIDLLDANGTESFNFMTSTKGTHVERLNDLRVVAYVFTKGTYQIIQSEMIDVPYLPAPPFFTSNIADGAVDVDTLPSIEFISDKELFNADSSEITDIASYIEFTKANDSNSLVAFTAMFGQDKKTITIHPVSAFERNTAYVVRIGNVASSEGVLTGGYQIQFVTINPVGINISQNLGFTVYPNPVHQQLTITLNDVAQVQLMDITGKICLSEIFSAGEQLIDVAGVEPGMYILSVTINHQNQTCPVIKYK